MDYLLSGKRIREEAISSQFLDRVCVYDDLSPSIGLGEFYWAKSIHAESAWIWLLDLETEIDTRYI